MIVEYLCNFPTSAVALERVIVTYDGWILSRLLILFSDKGV